MIPPVSSRRPPVLKNLESKAHLSQLSPTVENLIKIGFIDGNYHLLFTPSHIPPIKRSRWDALMKSKVGEISLAEYIIGFSKTLAEKGIEIDSYLRGGYAATVACIPEYFNFLLEEFLASKNLPAFAKLETDVPLPHDIDLFDHVINKGIPPTAIELYYMEYLKELSLQFTKKLIPKTSNVFPYKEDYVLFVVEGVDRIIGRLNHPYLFTRDDIRIKCGELVPESAGNFWQMVVERSLKIVRLEPWHEKDFRAGLAALQLMQEGHILIQDACPLDRIFRYAVSTGSDKIYTGAIDRSKLHCKNPKGFLLSAHIAYAHAGGNVPIEAPSLPSLYKLALFSLCYKTPYKAYFESGMLILHWHEHKIIFPKHFTVTSTEPPFYETDDWDLQSQTDPQILDCPLAPLERVLFELTFQKSFTPLSESMKDALVDYLIEDNSVELRGRFSHWLKPGKGMLGWAKVFLNYSIKHGLRLWKELKQEEKFAGIEAIVDKPVYSYSLLGDVLISKELRIRHLKTILKNPSLKSDLAEKIFEELIEANSLPLQGEIETYYQNTKNLKRLIWWISLDLEGAISTLKKHREVLKTEPETYIRFIKLFKLTDLAKEWIGSFPVTIRSNQTLLNFADADPTLLDSISELPGLKEKDLLEKLYCQGQPVFKDRPSAKLLEYMNQSFSAEIKEEIFKTLTKTPCTVKELALLQRSLTVQYVPYCLENPELLPMALNHLISLKKTDPLWIKALNIALQNKKASHCLIPFFKNKRWVQEVYREEAEAKTQEWGKALLSDEALVEREREAVIHILSRSTLSYSPLNILRHHLQSVYGETFLPDIKASYNKILDALITSFKVDDPQTEYSMDRLFTLFKLGLAAKIYTIYELNFFEGLQKLQLPSPDIPMFHFVQTLPLVEFESEELYNRWNNIREQILQNWSHVQTPLKIAPYDLAVTTKEYANKFQLITEQYILNKVALDEFQEEVQYIAKTSPGEDPCLICIENLLFLLTFETHRERAYEAFHFLLKSSKTGLGLYLKSRKTLEDLILSKTRTYANFKMSYSQIIVSLEELLTPHLNTASVNTLYIQDPILDSFELKSIHPIDKRRFQQTWLCLLQKYNKQADLTQEKKIKGYMLFIENHLIDTETISYIKKRVQMLSQIMKFLTTEHKNVEVAEIMDIAITLLPKEKTLEQIHFMEKTLSMNIPYKFEDK